VRLAAGHYQPKMMETQMAMRPTCLLLGCVLVLAGTAHPQGIIREFSASLRKSAEEGLFPGGIYLSSCQRQPSFGVAAAAPAVG
jgi:hypothetical protein